jgi:hypothetical protein
MEDISAKKAAFYKSFELGFFFILHNGRTETDADFQVILERELKRNNLKDTLESKSFLASILIPEIDRLINLHKENRSYGIGLDAPLLQVAVRFKDWLLKKEPIEHKQTEESKPTITAYALMHVYLTMYGGQAVTQQNKKDLVKKYGYSSGEQLRNDFTYYQNEDKRLELNSTNKRSANTHLERYRNILPLLETQNLEAFEAATKDFDKLEKEYNKYY